MFIFCLNSESLMSGSWGALVQGDNTILLEGPVSRLPSFQLLNRCWCGGAKNIISWPRSPVLLYISLYWYCVGRRTLTKSLQTSLPCFHINLNLCVTEVGIGNWLSTRWQWLLSASWIWLKIWKPLRKNGSGRKMQGRDCLRCTGCFYLVKDKSKFCFQTGEHPHPSSAQESPTAALWG